MNENPMGIAQRRWTADKKSDATGMHSPYLLRPWIIAAVLFIFFLVGIAGYLEKWLWMRQLDYTGIFWTLLSVQWVMFCSAFVFAFLYLWINLRQAAKNSAAARGDGQAWRLDLPRQPFYPEPMRTRKQRLSCPPRLLKVAVVLISAGVALFLASGFYANGIPISAFVTVAPSDFPIRFLASMSGFMSFIFPSMFCCKAA